MNNDLIIEIGTEEMPNSFLNYINSDLSSILTEILKEFKISFSSVEAYSTPRRIIAFIHDISSKQENAVVEKQGPPYTIFYKDEKITEVGKKFLRSSNLTEKEITIKETKKGKYIFSTTVIKGKLLKDIIQDLIDTLLSKIHLNKSMKWDDSSLEFIRPIRWVCGVYQGKKIDFHIGNISSDKYSRGHRFLSDNKKITVESISQIKKTLLDNYVVLDPSERKKRINNEIKKNLKPGNIVLENEELLKEVANLVEYPFIQLCEFDKEFLQIPSEFISTALIHHQRTFPVYKNNRITNNFFVVLNSKPNNNTKTGNERVLRARLNDARFFVQEDRKVKDLEKFNEKLKSVLFLNDLGTLYDKVNRIYILSDALAGNLNLEPRTLEKVRRTAKLSKIDLASAIVYEFPELQGKAGKIYAQESGEDKEVAAGIDQHYMPRNASDDYPDEKTGIIVGLADKIDNITGCFIKGFIPTGSEDPYQIRRYTLAIINLLLKNKIFINIFSLFQLSFKIFYDQKLNAEEQNKELINRILVYIKNRYKTILLDEGYKHDEIESIINLPISDLLDLSMRIKELKTFRKKSKFKDLLIALKRMTNIIKGTAVRSDLNEALLDQKEEKELYSLFKKNVSPFNRFIQEKKYQEAFKLLSEYKETVDSFFDKVLVMHKDEKLKTNRLALLNILVEHFNQLMDFSCISEKI
ncbi:MAG: glycine--tRNA ligase subunit beta [Spirochaetes bacterium]|nr:glycine--tRNA ligase subunit beta [Spirochaetota bacterium]